MRDFIESVEKLAALIYSSLLELADRAVRINGMLEYIDCVRVEARTA